MNVVKLVKCIGEAVCLWRQKILCMLVKYDGIHFSPTCIQMIGISVFTYIELRISGSFRQHRVCYIFYQHSFHQHYRYLGAGCWLKFFISIHAFHLHTFFRHQHPSSILEQPFLLVLCRGYFSWSILLLIILKRTNEFPTNFS